MTEQLQVTPRFWLLFKLAPTSCYIDTVVESKCIDPTNDNRCDTFVRYIHLYISIYKRTDNDFTAIVCLCSELLDYNTKILGYAGVLQVSGIERMCFLQVSFLCTCRPTSGDQGRLVRK